MKLALTKPDLEANPNLMDWAFRTVRRPGDVIVVGEGANAETLGCWAFAQFGYRSLADGVGLVLEGGATLRLSAAAVRHPDPKPASPFVHILFMGPESYVRGGILDCNGPAHPGISCSGPRAFGRVTVSDVCIIGCSGKKSGAEAFAFSSEGETGGTTISGVSVVKCLTSGHDDYVSGIYVGATADNGVESTVSGCHVDLGYHGWFAYSSTFATRFKDCTGVAQRFWYTDTGPGIATLVRCSGQAAYSVIGAVATQQSDTVRNVAASGCAFKALGDSSRGVEWWNKDAASRNQGGVTFINCTLEGFRWRAAVAANTGTIAFINTKVQSIEPDVIQPGGIRPFTTQTL